MLILEHHSYFLSSEIMTFKTVFRGNCTKSVEHNLHTAQSKLFTEQAPLGNLILQSNPVPSNIGRIQP